MQHLDEARRAAEQVLAEFLRGKSRNWRVLLIEDVLARLRMVLWCPKKDWDPSAEEIRQKLAEVSPAFWSGDVIQGSEPKKLPDGPWQAEAWEEARDVESATKLRVLARHRAKTGWFEGPTEPPWALRKREPAIVLFYSFKGGVGRSTALAAAALQLAAEGERVVVLDADLDAPGVGSLLAGHDGATASWGIVDYLLERPLMDRAGLDLGDYFHRCPSSLVPGTGEILVFPVGTLDGGYLDKLARLDYGSPHDGREHPFTSLLQQVREELEPRWILVDARAGLGDASGFLTGGLCHLHLLIGTLADASWEGLALLLDRLGGQRD
ncbi:MAG: P-loop NTPase [Candidatus Marinimicrobia bacterium]|nr:P-loop NTPase [Candidatus Neomarinimicrobiota bacterium]